MNFFGEGLMKKKVKAPLGQVSKDVEEIEVVRELRALMVALQREIKSLKSTLEIRTDKVRDMEIENQNLNDRNESLEEELDDREDDSYDKGYQYGYDAGHEDGFQEGQEFQAAE